MGCELQDHWLKTKQNIGNGTQFDRKEQLAHLLLKIPLASDYLYT